MCGIYASLHNVRHRKLHGLNLASVTPPFFKWMPTYGTLKSRGNREEDEVRAGQVGPRSKTEGCRAAGPMMPDGRAGRVAIGGPGAGRHGVPRWLG